jgi:hypothetical protein
MAKTPKLPFKLSFEVPFEKRQLSVMEAATFLGISHQQLRKMIGPRWSGPKPKSFPIGTRRMFTGADLLAFVEELKNKAA